MSQLTTTSDVNDNNNDARAMSSENRGMLAQVLQGLLRFLDSSDAVVQEHTARVLVRMTRTANHRREVEHKTR
eukprot:319054-Rhodomonas_salina.2